MASMTQEDVLDFLDLLDLDEELIDQRLKSLMVRNSHTSHHLLNSLHLLQYKLLINLQEGSECDNDEECNFIAKLLAGLSQENIDHVCKITYTVLKLNPSSLPSKAEHLLQQILSDLLNGNENVEEDYGNTLRLKLKVCDTILDAAVENNVKLSMLFLETPLENVLNVNDDKLKSHFLLNTVPRLFSTVVGYNILDRIWNFIQNLATDKQHLALKVLVTLADYYIPTVCVEGKLKYQSDVILLTRFWQIILFGINSNDSGSKKISIYLAKRSVECFLNMKRNATITTEAGLMIFKWDISIEKELKTVWDNYFTLIESLEEKQANIVLPSLLLFESIQRLGQDWLNIAYNIGFNHPNTQVKQKCIEYRMKTKLNNVSEAKKLLDALNDINLYAKPKDIDSITFNIAKMLQEHAQALTYMFKAFPTVNWSPVPLYYASKVFANSLYVQKYAEALSSGSLFDIICDILQISCNNLLIKRKVQTDVLKLLDGNCKSVTREQLTKLMSILQKIDHAMEHEESTEYINIVANWLKNIEAELNEDTLKYIKYRYYQLDVKLVTLNKDNDKWTKLIQEVVEKVNDLGNVLNRQYCDKLECFNVVAHLVLLYNDKTEGVELRCIKDLIKVNFHMLTKYVLHLLLNEKTPNDDEMKFMDCNLHQIFEHASKEEELIQDVQQIVKTCMTIVKDPNSELTKKIFASTILKVSLNANQEENIKLKDLINAPKCLENNKNHTDSENRSRLLNKFYQILCETIHLILSKKHKVIFNIEDEIIHFIDNTVECGGYGCLQWILKIMRVILPTIYSEVNFYDIIKFIDRMWKEIEELKSNHQYTVCMEDFIDVLLDILKDKSKYNDVLKCVVLHYCKRIIELGDINVKPLLILSRKMADMPLTRSEAYFLHMILLFTPVPRKDQRITNSAAMDIICSLSNGQSFTRDLDSPQHIAASTLLNTSDEEVIKYILQKMINEIDSVFKNKQRYHGNSHHHRMLLSALQHILLILLIRPSVIGLYEIKWCVDMLKKIPHQPSVKACFEWIVALYIYLEKLELSAANLDILGLTSAPQLSQFLIPYLVLKCKIKNGTYKKEEYTFLMEYLLSHTMGQQFNVRLHAQYLASKLHQNTSTTFDFTIKLIHKNFKESENEKNYIKIKEDFFVNEFDIVHNLTPKFIYMILPTQLGDETDNIQFSLPTVAKCIAYIKANKIENEVTRTWFCAPKDDDNMPILRVKLRKEDTADNNNEDSVGTIQKKYIPWSNMTDIDGFEADKKKSETTSGLIVVASLIDKLPNLGGLARTSEVFGVQTYVIDSLRHVQDRQFQGLSLSAERWVDIEEVRPGKPLKDYLMRKKCEGYSVVAAEQTSNSVPLQLFKFPKKTLLLLGHEKEGVPSDLLLLADSFVEIPQQGFVRSLNVHVTAALFVWEYTRQHTLSISS